MLVVIRQPSPAAPTLKRAASVRRSRRGRPPKYGRPSQVVALTLPRRVVQALGRLHSDLGWAIVTLVEKANRLPIDDAPDRDVELVEVGDGHFLIVVNPTLCRGLAGVQLAPLSATQAFLTLDPGRGVTDLELAVIDRLDQLKEPTRERQAIARLGAALRKWRRDRQLSSHSRSVVILTKRGQGRSAAR